MKTRIYRRDGSWALGLAFTLAIGSAVANALIATGILANLSVMKANASEYQRSRVGDSEDISGGRLMDQLVPAKLWQIPNYMTVNLAISLASGGCILWHMRRTRVEHCEGESLGQDEEAR